MDAKTANILNEMTMHFYDECSASFSSTRKNPWKGWDTLAGIIEAQGFENAVSLLDVGCGNLRLEAFLEKTLPLRLDAWCIDSCPALLDDKAAVHFQQLDVMQELINGHDLQASIDAPECDLVCSFGLMHHVPGADNRDAFLSSLLDKTIEGGIAAVSLWRFMEDERLASKALATTKKAMREHPDLALEENDWLLSWSDEKDVMRYCHSFDEGEIDDLIDLASKKADLIGRYAADGRSGDLNCYLVFKRT